MRCGAQRSDIVVWTDTVSTSLVFHVYSVCWESCHTEDVGLENHELHHRVHVVPGRDRDKITVTGTKAEAPLRVHIDGRV